MSSGEHIQTKDENLMDDRLLDSQFFHALLRPSRQLLSTISGPRRRLGTRFRAHLYAFDGYSSPLLAETSSIYHGYCRLRYCLQCISDPPVPQFSFETGTSFGGIVFPIMLNHLFHGSVGFAWGVRTQAFVVFGLLAAANCLMSRPAQWNARPEIAKAKVLAMLKDVPFLLSIWG